MEKETTINFEKLETAVQQSVKKGLGNVIKYHVEKFNFAPGSCGRGIKSCKNFYASDILTPTGINFDRAISLRNDSDTISFGRRYNIYLYHRQRGAYGRRDYSPFGGD